MSAPQTAAHDADHDDPSIRRHYVLVIAVEIVTVAALWVAGRALS